VEHYKSHVRSSRSENAARASYSLVDEISGGEINIILVFSRIPRHRQLVHSRSDVHVLRLGRYRASYEQIFVVEEVPDHHSARESRNQSRNFLVSLSDFDFSLFLYADPICRCLDSRLQRSSN
jgi:hypothetical protein